MRKLRNDLYVLIRNEVVFAKYRHDPGYRSTFHYCKAFLNLKMSYLLTATVLASNLIQLASSCSNTYSRVDMPNLMTIIINVYMSLRSMLSKTDTYRHLL